MSRGDLVVLTPDLQWTAVLQAILARPEALGIRPLRHRVVNQPGRTDAWVRREGAAFTRAFLQTEAHGLLVFDHEGSDAKEGAEDLERRLDAELERVWGPGRAAAVVVEPELEAWLLGAGTGFRDLAELRQVDARAWWAANADWPMGAAKPADPKGAVERLLRAHQNVPSAAIYRKVTSKASLRPETCRTRSYPRFVAQLRRWFPQP